ncbi:hypothetical protein ES332_D12G093900v1 [Gossypium tomentosum]|uniref:Uncharacterized protein n=1 Tax=Gossypium tomentosum TaxID=34277 RepID=A0A5D2I6I2_GOSTO|nr:hypothetical protein ES332_D12G093900v1 [Gossypium tomentosum]
MHFPYSASPPPNRHLVARNAITARFGYGAITSIGCNSHSPREASIRDFAHVSYFLFHSLPSSSFRSIDSPTFPFQRSLLAARTLLLFILQMKTLFDSLGG